MAVYDDEIFGPVLSVVRVATFDDALALVNANPYGNGVALFSRDGGAARRFERDVNVGMIGINVPDPRAGRVALLRRVEGVVVRRRSHLRSRGHPLLHPPEGRHDALARPGVERHRPRLPDQRLTGQGQPWSSTDVRRS